MKIRNGFVSNSSSSSFCIIGVQSSIRIQQLSEAEKMIFKWGDNAIRFKNVRGCEHPIKKGEKFCKECGKPAYKQEEAEIRYDYLSYGIRNGKVVDFYGDGNCPCCAGVDAHSLLQTMTIPQAQEYFCKMVKDKLKVDLSPNDVSLLYGEAGEG